MKNADMDPLEELMRARLRIPHGADLRLKALLAALGAIDGISRMTSGQAFFALRETREMLVRLDGKTGTKLLDALLAMKGGTTVTPTGLEHIPSNGRVVIGSTHPIGTFDFIAHAAALKDHRPDLKVVAGRESERFLGPDLLIAVDMDRKDKVTTPRHTFNGMRAHLQNDGALLVFGSGRVPKMVDGRLVEPPWRGGVTRISTKCDAPIVPACPDMQNSPHYYRTRRIVSLLSRNEELGRRVSSFRYLSELFAKLGGTYEVHYGPIQDSGTAPERLKVLAEGLVPGLYGVE